MHIEVIDYNRLLSVLGEILVDLHLCDAFPAPHGNLLSRYSAN
jgi:hypothetical protein